MEAVNLREKERANKRVRNIRGEFCTIFRWRETPSNDGSGGGGGGGGLYGLKGARGT